MMVIVVGKKRLGEIRSSKIGRLDLFAGSGKASGLGDMEVKADVLPAFRCLYDEGVFCQFKKYEGYSDISDLCEKCKYFVDVMTELFEEDQRVDREIEMELKAQESERFARERALLLKQMEEESDLEKRKRVRD
jgi:hypothetical protein